MRSFEPDRIQVPCGHFIGGRVLPAPERFTVSRPSDGKPHAGLPCGVHTADIGRALRAMRGIAAGTVWINRYGRTNDFVIPTGGFHQSSIGKDLGRQAVEANLRQKSVLIDFGASSDTASTQGE